MHKIGFIGSGNMGSALIMAACRSIGADKVLITNRNLEKAEALSENIGCDVAKTNIALAKEAEYIVLAVKPDTIRIVAKEIAQTLKEEKDKGISHVIVTIAAGISIETIKENVGDFYPVIRIMPNTPVMVGYGMTLITGPSETDKSVVEFMELLSSSGDFLYIEEEKFDITTGISGCSPAYTYMFIDSLADGAVQVGVPRDRALLLAAKTVLGSAQMIIETGTHPDKLKDDVCSPGGSTIQGVNALEQNNFRYGVAQAIIEATKKNLELGK